MSKRITSYTVNGKTYHAKGFNILVEIDDVPTTMGSGIIQITELQRDKLLQARMTGVVKAIGKLAFSDKKEAYCKVGDRICFKRYDGVDVNRTVEGSIPTHEPLLRFMLDEMVLGVIEEVKE